MAVQLNVNSYVTVAEADTYFADRLDASWQTANETRKGQALVTATRMLDEMLWVGTVLNDEQPLAFPRVCEYFDPKSGTFVYLNGDSTPKRVITACMEQAEHLLTNEGLLNDTDSVDSISVGPIKLDTMRAAQKVASTVKTMIKPLLVNAGANLVWRAN